MTLDELLVATPIAYHATREENLPGLLAEGCLLSPSEIQRRRGTSASTSPRRSGSKGSGRVKFAVPLGEGVAYLCDHDRLHEGNIAFEDGWDMRRFIGRLNSLVFFWPGQDDGPIQQGVAHRMRYAKADEDFVVLRAPLLDLVAMNGPPFLSSCNSGAPRHHPVSRRQPRGARTFCSLETFPAAGEIVEIVFEVQAALPATTLLARSYADSWTPLFPRGS